MPENASKASPGHQTERPQTSFLEFADEYENPAKAGFFVAGSPLNGNKAERRRQSCAEGTVYPRSDGISHLSSGNDVPKNRDRLTRSRILIFPTTTPHRWRWPADCGMTPQRGIRR